MWLFSPSVGRRSVVAARTGVADRSGDALNDAFGSLNDSNAPFRTAPPTKAQEPHMSTYGGSCGRGVSQHVDMSWLTSS
jgi:hypothetical protein